MILSINLEGFPRRVESMPKYKELINHLHWNLSQEIQENAIEELSKLSVKEIRYLIQPKEKAYWHNAAIVIQNILKRNQISNQEEKEILFLMMQWTQDLNWPGVNIIVDTLKILEVDLVKEMIQESFKVAIEENDECWMDSLESIAEQLGLNERGFL